MPHLDPVVVYGLQAIGAIVLILSVIFAGSLVYPNRENKGTSGDLGAFMMFMPLCAMTSVTGFSLLMLPILTVWEPGLVAACAGLLMAVGAVVTYISGRGKYTTLGGVLGAGLALTLMSLITNTCMWLSS